MSPKKLRPISLSEYIKELGEQKFSKKYGISIRSTQAYRYGQRQPPPKVAARIVQSAPALTWESIYCPPKPRRKQPRR